MLPPSSAPDTPHPGPDHPGDVTEARDWLHQIGDPIESLLWEWDPASRRAGYVNPAFRSVWNLGDDASGADPAGWLDRVHPEDRARVRSLWTGTPQAVVHTEFRCLLADGEERWLRARAIPLRDRDGTLRRVIHVLLDITERRLGAERVERAAAQLSAEAHRRADAERHLREVSERLQRLIDTANDAVITIDAHSIIIDWNRTAETMFGWRRDEALGRTITEVIVPQRYRPLHHGGIRRFFDSGASGILNQRIETRALRRSGEEFDVELSVWPVKAAEGCTFSSFVRDISGRKAAQRALQESEYKYRAVVENANEGILVSAGNRVRYANRKALEIAGRDEAALHSQPLLELLHPDDRERVKLNNERRLRGEAVDNHYQVRLLMPDGQERWLELNAVVFHWEGSPATLIFLNDVTRKRQIEAEIRTTLQRERELSELKSRFVALTSHELRTPLAAILSSVELLEDFGDSMAEAERREITALVKGSVLRMNAMIEQVLLMSRLEAGTLGFQPAACDAAALLHEICAEVLQAHAQAAPPRLEIAPGLGLRRLDAKLLRHIAVNLLGNALKYTPSGEAATVALAGDDTGLVLTVSDRGIGIPSEDLPRLFNAFHRGANVGALPGTGLGLVIVRECVALHGGRIEVDSRPGAGTTFRVRLAAPRAAAEDAPSPPREDDRGPHPDR